MSRPNREGSAPTRWWGWQGSEARPPALSDRQLQMLTEELGPLEPWGHPEAPDEVSIPPAVEIAGRLARELGPLEIDGSHQARVLNAAGKSYVDLARIRERRLETAPDLVVRPADRAQVAAALAWCAENGIAAVPFGGGTSVVGGVEALRGDCEAVISLDLGRLDGVEVDRSSYRARLGAGLRGPDAESALARHGLTLGHFPQSHEQATVGGYAATRSAGQASTGNGRFDAMVAGLEMATAAGGLLSVGHAHTAAGPSLRELALGSEGAFGVITEVTARVRARPEERRYEGWMLKSFADGAAAVSAFMQAGTPPEVVRLSDREETRVSVSSSSAGAATRALQRGYLALRRREHGCLLVLGFEGSTGDVATRRAGVASILREHGAAYLGRGPGNSWERGRFAGPYHRDELMDRGVMVETFETAHSWTGLRGLYEGVREGLAKALSELGSPGLVMCHLSHAYRDGASLYFTVLCPARQTAAVAQWRELKTAAGEAIVAAGGTITHHHAVGSDHLPWMRDEVGETGLEVLRGIKAGLDPSGVMNPGKLIPQSR